MGITNVLEACRDGSVAQLTYARTSSVYGATIIPFSEHDGVVIPAVLGGTKRANELMSHSHLFALPATAPQFFTVHGPWGRPDMPLFKFTSNVLAIEPIDGFNQGKHTRDVTYIDDIVESVIRAAEVPAAPDVSWNPAQPDPASWNAPWRIFNIGNSDPVNWSITSTYLKTPWAKKQSATCYRSSRATQSMLLPTCAGWHAIGYLPTLVRIGIRKFVEWYKLPSTQAGTMPGG